jgi:hypothetical protein
VSYFIVYEDREDPSRRYIVAQFSKSYDAEEYVENIGGELVSNEADIAELVKAWREGDYSFQAHQEAGQVLAELYRRLRDLRDDREDLIAQYAETDPLCEAVTYAMTRVREARDKVDETIPPGVATFHGVHVRGPWKPSKEAIEALGQVKAREAMEEAEAAVEA